MRPLGLLPRRISSLFVGAWFPRVRIPGRLVLVVLVVLAVLVVLVVLVVAFAAGAVTRGRVMRGLGGITRRSGEG